MLKKTSKSCIIVGNGPSLKEVNFSIFKGHDVFISNYAGLSAGLLSYATYLTIVNPLVAEQGADELNASAIPTKITPAFNAEWLKAEAGFTYANANGLGKFQADDPSQAISWKSTVSFFNMQLAYNFGHETVYLVGFDHHYTQCEGMEEGELIDQIDDDLDHFNPEYFKGKTWQAGDPLAMEQMYLLARDAFDKAGRKIINCTAGSHLDVFDKAPVSILNANFLIMPFINIERAQRNIAPVDPRCDFDYKSINCSHEKFEDGYQQEIISIKKLKWGQRFCNDLRIKFQYFTDGTSCIEFRPYDSEPYLLMAWPEEATESDEWGPYFRSFSSPSHDMDEAWNSFCQNLKKHDAQFMNMLIKLLHAARDINISTQGQHLIDLHYKTIKY